MKGPTTCPDRKSHLQLGFAYSDGDDEPHEDSITNVERFIRGSEKVAKAGAGVMLAAVLGAIGLL